MLIVAALQRQNLLPRGFSVLSVSIPANDKNFSAVLYPNRSLSKAGYYIIMTIVGLANLALAVLFILLSAWPVPVIFLTVFLAVWLAFELSFRNAQAYERIDITEEEMRILHVYPLGRRRETFFHPFWARVDLIKRKRRPSTIEISSKDQSIVVGSFLAPSERPRLAASLKDALHRIRA